MRLASARNAALVGLVLACGSGGGGPTAPEAPDGPVPIEGRIGELEFQALLLQPTWDRLVGRVTLTNPTGAPIEVRFPDTCVVLLRLYTLTESRLAVDGHNKRCLPFPVEVSLAPGESQTFETTVAFFAVVGIRLPEGHYRAILYLRPDAGDEVEIAVGTPGLFRPPDETP